MDAHLIKTPQGRIEPADQESADAIRKMTVGQVFRAKIVKPRNYENHKRFFAFLKTTFDMQEHFETTQHYRNWLTMKAGWYITITAPNGNVLFIPKSISFDEMGEIEFQELFSECIDVFIRELGNGISEDELMRILEFG